MKYRVVKRTLSNGLEYYVIQERWWIMPWDDVHFLLYPNFHRTYEEAKKRCDQLRPTKHTDIVING